MSELRCGHDAKYALFGLDRRHHGCLACAYEVEHRERAGALTRVEELRAAIKRHNDGCQARCGYGDQEAVRCGWRPYFEGSGRRCPTCPTYNVIEIDGAAGQPPEGQKP